MILQNLLEDSTITEVFLNSFCSVFYEQSGEIKKSQSIFSSPMAYHNYIFDLLKKAQDNIDSEKPFCSFEYQKNRYQILSPHITKSDYVVSIRKHFYQRFSLENFFEDPKHQELVLTPLAQRKNILIIGSTGSGKTTFLNTCLDQVSRTDRLVILEDTPEIQTQIPNAVHMYTRTNTPHLPYQVTLSHLIREALRIRPDRLILGEVRGEEAKELLMALSTGHRGSLVTLHASHAHEALMRLEMLTQLGAPQWTSNTIKKIIYFGIEYIVHIKRNSLGHRTVQQVSKVTGLESSGFLLEDLIRSPIQERHGRIF